MKKIKNNTMGFIPSTQDRSVYERRREYIASLNYLGQSIVSDFEKNFVGNLVNGFLFSNVLKSFIVDFQAYMLNKSLDIIYWFDNTPSKTIYGINTDNYMPVDFNNLFSKDLKYKSLIRTDGKLAPFTYCLGFVSDATNTLLKNALMLVPKTLANATAYSLLSPTATFWTTQGYSGTYAQLTSSMTFDMPTSATLSFYLQNYLGTSPLREGFNLDISDAVTTSKTHYVTAPNGFTYVFTTTPSTKASYHTVKVLSVAFYSLNDFFSSLNDALAIIQWLESESVALNVEGNYDGIKTDGFEQLLNDQLDYLNSMTDRVENSLIGSKLDGQKQKDAVQAQIDQRRLDLQNVIAQKKADIKKMNEANAKFQSLIQNRIII